MPQQSIVIFLKATAEQVPSMKRIADANRDELGFVNRAKLSQVVTEGRAIVALCDNEVFGFVIFRHRKTDTQTTLSEICLEQGFRGQGYGRGLIDALYSDCIQHSRSYIRLKCPVDLAANAFYERVGFQKVGTEVGRVRQLNIWDLPIV
jgi:ribosomal protein S18 acetylase RimI-like enzyme